MLFMAHPSVRSESRQRWNVKKACHAYYIGWTNTEDCNSYKMKEIEEISSYTFDIFWKTSKTKKN